MSLDSVYAIFSAPAWELRHRKPSSVPVICLNSRCDPLMARPTRCSIAALFLLLFAGLDHARAGMLVTTGTAGACPADGIVTLAQVQMGVSLVPTGFPTAPVCVVFGVVWWQATCAFASDNTVTVTAYSAAGCTGPVLGTMTLPADGQTCSTKLFPVCALSLFSALNAFFACSFSFMSDFVSIAGHQCKRRIRGHVSAAERVAACRVKDAGPGVCRTLVGLGHMRPAAKEPGFVLSWAFC
jgi:hypothetical protein